MTIKTSCGPSELKCLCVHVVSLGVGMVLAEMVNCDPAPPLGTIEAMTLGAESLVAEIEAMEGDVDQPTSGALRMVNGQLAWLRGSLRDDRMEKIQSDRDLVLRSEASLVRAGFLALYERTKELGDKHDLKAIGFDAKKSILHLSLAADHLVEVVWSKHGFGDTDTLLRTRTLISMARRWASAAVETDRGPWVDDGGAR